MTDALLKVASIFVCALPPRYRERWPLRSDEDLRGPAIVSGLLEFVISAPGTMFFIASGLATARGGFGIAGIFLNPFAIFPLFFVDGAVRFLAALASHQIVPTWPLGLIAWLARSKEDKLHQLSLGTLVPDKVERGDGKPWHLRVLSCRAKPHWNTYNSVHFEGEFYQLCGQDLTTGQRKFVYLLRKQPETRLVVVVYDYHPNDVLSPDKPPQRWKPTSAQPPRQ
jgi:hypothetical protein